MALPPDRQPPVRARRPAPPPVTGPAGPASRAPGPRVPQTRLKHPARRARTIVAGAAAAATVGLIGGFALAAPPSSADAPGTALVPGDGAPAAGRTSASNSAGQATPSTTAASRTSPSTRVAPATPSQRVPTRPQARSRAS